MNRFFIDQPLSLNQQLILPEHIAHHWKTVLRAEVGDRAVLFNGTGGEFTAQIEHTNNRSTTVMLTDFDPIMRTPKRHTQLALVMTKGDRLDFAIQKATELGVADIHLLTSERCEMRLKYARDQQKILHWQKVAISACEQCGMNYVPRIHPPQPLEAWLTNQSQTGLHKLILAPNQKNSVMPWHVTSWADLLPIICLIGPEGGFSAAELDYAITCGFIPWSLGTRILRAETAPITALSIINEMTKH